MWHFPVQLANGNRLLMADKRNDKFNFTLIDMQLM